MSRRTGRGSLHNPRTALQQRGLGAHSGHVFHAQPGLAGIKAEAMRELGERLAGVLCGEAEHLEWFMAENDHQPRSLSYLAAILDRDPGAIRDWASAMRRSPMKYRRAIADDLRDL